MNTNKCEVIWDNLELKTKQERHVLSDVSGQIKPKTLTAILGPSGSGKTSLLDCISGRISPELSLHGEIRVNNMKRDLKTWPKLVSYVGQQFHSYEWQTVYETLSFVASIKCQTHNEKIIAEKINNLINLLGLTHSRDTFIGKLSGGEKVRVSLGIELLGDPPIILLDEPLSGLDSFNALNILSLLRTIADMDKTILITIHQPSYKMLEYFDKIILMCQGCTVFEGTLSECIEFFKNCGFDLPVNATPTDYFLDVLSLDTRTEESTDKSMRRIQKIKSEWMVLKTNREPTNFTPIIPPAQSEPSITFQTLFKRSLINCYRNSGYLKAKVYQKLFFAFLFGTTFLRNGVIGSDVFTFRGIMTFILQNELFSISSPIMNVFIEERKVINRERMSGLYSGYEAYFSKLLCELIVNFLITIPYNLLVYALVGLQNDFASIFGFLSTILTVVTYSVSWGLMISTMASSSSTAQMIGVPFNVTFMLYSGAFSNPKTLPSFMKKLVWFSPLHYAFRALLHSQLSGVEGQNVGPMKVSGQKTIEDFGMDGFGLVPSLLMLFLFIGIFQVIGCTVLHYKTSNNMKLTQKVKKMSSV